MKTKVKFLINERLDNDLIAYFPNDVADLKGNKTCYSQIGQHSACCIEYANECREATIDEFENLAKELKSIGYDLHILNDIPLPF